MGFDYDTTTALPADAVGYGFDIIGDVQTLSPSAWKNIFEAARFIVNKAVPTTPRALGLQFAAGKDFLTARHDQERRSHDFYVDARSRKFPGARGGRLRVVISSMVDGTAKPDPQQCIVSIKTRRQGILQTEIRLVRLRILHGRDGIAVGQRRPRNHFHAHPLMLDLKQTTKMDYKILTVSVYGPDGHQGLEQSARLRKIFHPRLAAGRSPPSAAIMRGKC